VIIPELSERQHTEVARPERRGVSRAKVIDQAKAEIPVIIQADRLVAENGGGWRKAGDEWVARCPLPDHEDRRPSFTVNVERNLWFCHGCARGGDTVELARLARGFSKSEAAIAAAYLLQEFGHEVRRRPASWHAKQTRQERARKEVENAKIRRMQRRIYRWLLAPQLISIENEAERLEEAQHAWAEARRIAELLALQTRGEAE
jgi:hypothetical protein